jgi:hypothetical protein
MNLSEFSKLRSQIDLEFENLRKALDRHPELVVKCRTEIPNPLEIDGLANMLHSFYTGTENIFKRICLALEGEAPTGPSYHKDLLYRMANDIPCRPRVLSDSLCATLESYLNFRHRFRHAYGFELRWSKMASLVHEIEKTLKRLKLEIGAFLESLESRIE